MQLDESVGRVVAALQTAGMLENSIIVFTTDNGGPAAGFDINHASNWPLRGAKETLWEGGTRTPAFITAPSLLSPRVEQGLVHVTDWFPSLLSAAGAGPPSDTADMDGVDQWARWM